MATPGRRESPEDGTHDGARIRGLGREGADVASAVEARGMDGSVPDDPESSGSEYESAVADDDGGTDMVIHPAGRTSGA